MADKQEFESWDSDSGWWMNNARLTKDPEIKHTANGDIVRLSFVSTSRNKGKNDVVDLWVEVTPDQYCTEPAKYLKKGDELTRIEGHEEFRRFGDDNKTAFCIKFAKLRFSAALKAELKKRGWNPSNKATTGKPADKKPTTTRTRRQVQQVQELPE